MTPLIGGSLGHEAGAGGVLYAGTVSTPPGTSSPPLRRQRTASAHSYRHLTQPQYRRSPIFLHISFNFPNLFDAHDLPSPHLILSGLPLIILGSITFIPGSYHTRIAYLAWKGRNGYSLNQIPDF